MITSVPSIKASAFEKFLLQRNPSRHFVNKYIAYLGASVVKNAVRNVAKVYSIYEVEKMDQLLLIYNDVKGNPSNVRLHNVYSGAISAYIKFLNGKELRKRVVAHP